MTPHLYVESGPQRPDDQELLLLTEYVGGFMTDAEAEAFNERLMDDVEFFARMEPFLDEWYAPGVLPVEIDIAKRLEAEHRSRRITRVRRLGGYRLPLAVAAAAALAFALIPTGSRKSTATDTQVARTDVHRVEPPRVVAAVPAVPAVQPSRGGRSSGATAVATPSRPTRVAIGETVAERALVDSTMRPAGVVSSTRVTPLAEDVASSLVPPQIPALVTQPVTPDSTQQNAQEKGRDLSSPDKPTAAEGAVKRGWWQRLKGLWPFHIPPKDLVTGRTR